MTRIPFRLLGLIALSAFTACGNSISHRKLDQPREAVAELRGIPVEFKLLGERHYVAFDSLDGEKLQEHWSGGRPDIIDVLPGRHRVGVYYSMQFDGEYGSSGELEVLIDARAGKIYQAELLHDDVRGWYVEFREMALQSAKAGSTEWTAG